MANENLKFKSIDLGTTEENEKTPFPYFLASVHIVIIEAKISENNAFLSSPSNISVQIKFENQKFTSGVNWKTF